MIIKFGGLDLHENEAWTQLAEKHHKKKKIKAARAVQVFLLSFS